MKKRFLTVLGVALLLFFLRAALLQSSFTHALSSPDLKICRFDCVHYVEIADYARPVDAASTAFFPAWTSILRTAKILAPHVRTEVLVVWLSNLLLFASTVVSIFLAEALELSTPLLGRLFLPIALLIFPFGASSSFGYGEPLFLLLYLLALLSAQKRQYLWAAICLGMLSTTRVQGVIVAGAFSLTALVFGPWLERKKTALYTFIALLPFLAYVLWQAASVGDGLAFVHSQHQWGRIFSPWRALLDQAPRPKMFPVMIWICLVGSFLSIRKGTFFWVFLALATLGLTEVPLFSGGLMSYARYLSVNLGLFIFLAQLLSQFVAWRKRWTPIYNLIELGLFMWAAHGLVIEAAQFLINGVCP